MTAKSFALQSVVRGTSLLSCCLGLICAVTISAQSTFPSNQPPGVSVLDCKWLKTHYLPLLDSSYPTPPAVGEMSGEGVPSATRAPLKSSDAYRYSIHVRNQGPKVIKSMAWDYVFSDPDSKQELGRRSLNSFEKIGLNETKWIDLRPVHLAPPKVTTIEGLKKDRRSPFDEHVEIKCVLYAAGTGWKGSDTIGREGKANDPMPVIVPNPSVSAKPIERQFYTYSAELRNRGQKETKRLIWSFVFSDPVTHEELKRERGFASISISPGQKKFVKTVSASSPPRVINANSPKASSPFDQRVIVECVLFADGSLWESPEGKLKVIARATGQLTDLCENLAR